MADGEKWSNFKDVYNSTERERESFINSTDRTGKYVIVVMKRTKYDSPEPLIQIGKQTYRPAIRYYSLMRV